MSVPAATGRAARRRRARLARLTRPQTSSGLPISVLWLTAALGAAGFAAGHLAGPDHGPHVSGLSVTVLVAMLTAAGALQVQFQYRDEEEALDLFEAVLTPILFVLPGIGVVACTALAKGLSQGILRVPPAKAAFNVAQWTFATGLAALLFAAIRPAHPGTAATLPALLTAMIAVPIVNNLAILAVRRLAYGEPLRATLAAAAPTLGPGLVNGAANLGAGALFVCTLAWAPAAMPLFLVPLALMHAGGRALAAVQVDRALLRGLHRATHALGVPVDPRNAVGPFLAEIRTCYGARAVDCVLATRDGYRVHRSDGRGPVTVTDETGTSAALARLMLEVDSPVLVEAAEPGRDPMRDTGPLDGSMRGALDATPTAPPAGLQPGRFHVLSSALRREGWQSCLIAPMRTPSGPVTGVLAVYDRTGFRGFESGELTVLGTLAGELSSALHRGVLLDAILAERGKLADIVNRTSDGIATIAPDGTVLSWNPGFERISGWRAAEVTGRRTLPVLAARDAAGAPVPLDRWAEPGVRLPAEIEVTSRAGSDRRLSVSVTRTHDDQGDHGEQVLILTARDVTDNRELRRAEQALADHETRFQALVKHSSDLLMVVDADAMVSYASPACHRITGTSSDEWVGRTLFEIVHPDDADMVRAGFAILHRGVGEPIEFRVRAADGSVRHIEAIPNGLLDDPAVRGVVLSARDVTDRKRTDALLGSQVTILDLIARDAPLSDVLDELARVFEAQADGTRCLILLAGEDDPGPRVAAAPSVPESDLRAGPVTALWNAAVRERAPVVVADIDPAAVTDPGVPDRRHGALGDGIRAVWVAPVTAGGGEPVLGAIAVLHDRPRSPELPDWQVLELATHLAEIAIEQTTARRRIAHQAQHDALTALPNRLAFNERAAAALRRARVTGEQLAVLFLDLDRFKVINDSFGHDAGDRLLIQLAERLAAAVRPGDTLARFGGDEFTILCEGITDEGEALAIAERVRRVMSEPVQLPEGEVFVTGSIGISMAGGVAGPDGEPETIIGNADAAMYRAKARGGDRQEVFAEALRTGAKHRLAISSSLHRALERGEFRVLYQPTVSLESGRLVGVEALLRWLHPERGLLGPGEFIGLAEETGLIVPIGASVLAQACREAERWRAAGPDGRPLTISVNLSARQFAHPDLVSVVAEILAGTGTDPATLRLEITESVLMDDAASTNEALVALRELGVRLSIDDFGTGYSSLTYLKRFPVDELKVDRSFVDGLGDDPEDSAIVAAVVNLAHTLDLRVVAEGVETAEQSAHLRKLGCDAAQGFFFGRAVPPDEVGEIGIALP